MVNAVSGNASATTDIPTGPEIREKLTRIRAFVESLGVQVVDAVAPADNARFIGLLEKQTIILFPDSATPFALWFTVAHLFGHMTQMAASTDRVRRANVLVLRRGEELSPSDVQLIYDHELEAAEIGRTLIAALEPELPLTLDVAYTRFFLADFRYLVNAIETGESGPTVFARFWRREPLPRELIKADARPLLDMRTVVAPVDSIVVV